MDNLIIKPYNYLLSFTEYLTIPNSIGNIITIIIENTSKTYQFINYTIETSINDINYINYINDINDINSMSISDITMNDIIYIIYEYKIFISIMTLFSLITIYFMNKLIDEYFINLNHKNNKLKLNKNKSNNFNNININKFENHKPIEIQNILLNNNDSITEGLFIDSVLEINANHKNILNKIIVNNNNNNYYYALLRIKLKHNITLNKTNYNLQSIIVDTDNDSDTFSSSNMYMIIKFNYINTNTNTNIKLSQVIVNVMNVLNNYSQDIYKNEDFIVLAISKDTHNINPNEFYNGLRNINYDLYNVKHINLNKENTIGFTLLLPIKQIYELFLDVYNDIIFESTSYKIDFDNNEYYYNNSINDIF
jgi:hypothetical protein